MAFASSTKLVAFAVNSGGGCGGLWYCEGAILEFVMGLALVREVYGGRRCLNSEPSLGYTREDARMKTRGKKTERARITKRNFELDARMEGAFMW